MNLIDLVSVPLERVAHRREMVAHAELPGISGFLGEAAWAWVDSGHRPDAGHGERTRVRLVREPGRRTWQDVGEGEFTEFGRRAAGSGDPVRGLEHRASAPGSEDTPRLVLSEYRDGRVAFSGTLYVYGSGDDLLYATGFLHRIPGIGMPGYETLVLPEHVPLWAEGERQAVAERMAAYYGTGRGRTP